tara:strand:- start:43 stop:390 length:348 start_codon:yes stop_codon:yes gene_type:complete
LYEKDLLLVCVIRLMGRPRKSKEDRVKYINNQFYWPERYYFILDEFDKLCQKKLAIASVPSQIKRCRSIVLRRLIFQYLINNDLDNEVVKKGIKEFLEDENRKHQIIINNYRNKK